MKKALLIQFLSFLLLWSLGASRAYADTEEDVEIIVSLEEHTSNPGKGRTSNPSSSIILVVHDLTLSWDPHLVINSISLANKETTLYSYCIEPAQSILTLPSCLSGDITLIITTELGVYVGEIDMESIMPNNR